MKPTKLLAILSAAAMTVTALPVSVYAEETVSSSALSVYQSQDPALFGDNLTYLDMQYFLDTEGNAVISGYTGSSRNVVVPDKIGSAYVIAIGRNAFANCTSLQTVVLPDTVHSIEYAAFLGCKNLSKISFGSGLRFIDGRAFEDCYSLKELVIPDTVLMVGGVGAFNGCGAESVVFGRNVTETGQASLQWCGYLTDVIMKDGVQNISAQTFDRAANLRRTYIPSSVKTIGRDAFANNGTISTTEIFYGGSKLQWENIEKVETTACNFKNSKIYYDCPEPVTITSLKSSASGPVLAWTASAGAVAYRIYRSEDPKGVIVPIATVSSRTFTDNTAAAGKNYYYHIMAIKDNDSFSFSTPKKITAAAAALTAPKFTVTPGANGASVSWGAVSGATSYRVFYRLNGTTKWSYKNTTRTSMNLTGLTGGRKYDVVVRAYSATTKKWSKYSASDIQTVTPAKGLVKPTIIAATPYYGRIDLRWSGVYGAKSYRVYYRIKGTTVWKCKNTTLTAATLTGLRSGVTYEVVVRGTDGISLSPSSGVKRVTTL